MMSIDMPLLEQTAARAQVEREQWVKGLLTIAGWEAELKDIFSGSRFGKVCDCGGVDGYVKSLMGMAGKYDESEAAFREALEAVVDDWHPVAHTTSYHKACMLDLIQSFCPQNGDRQVAEFLLYVLLGELSFVKADSTGVEGDLHWKSLLALEKYVTGKVGVSCTATSRRIYLETLKRDLGSEAYSEYHLYARERLQMYGET